MYLYRISQGVNNSYDTYDSAVVAAENEHDALHTHPSGYSDLKWVGEKWCYTDWENYADYSWAPPKDVGVRRIGWADSDVEAGVVCSSFNAG